MKEVITEIPLLVMNASRIMINIRRKCQTNYASVLTRQTAYHVVVVAQKS